jgi:hypothetical protein
MGRSDIGSAPGHVCRHLVTTSPFAEKFAAVLPYAEKAFTDARPALRSRCAPHRNAC